MTAVRWARRATAPSWLTTIVQAIAAAHEASFRVTPRLDGGGLTARLVFPAPVCGYSSPAA